MNRLFVLFSLLILSMILCVPVMAQEVSTIDSVVSALVKQFPALSMVLMIGGAVVFLAQFVIALTPSKKDDEFLEKEKKNSIFKMIWDFFLSHAPFQKGASGFELSNKNVEK